MTQNMEIPLFVLIFMQFRQYWIVLGNYLQFGLVFWGYLRIYVKVYFKLRFSIVCQNLSKMFGTNGMVIYQKWEFL